MKYDAEIEGLSKNERKTQDRTSLKNKREMTLIIMSESDNVMKSPPPTCLNNAKYVTVVKTSYICLKRQWREVILVYN